MGAPVVEMGVPDLTRAPPTPQDTDGTARDWDCDGLSDAEEFATRWGGLKETDPTNPDTDGDGIKDGVEAGRARSPAVGCTFAGDGDPATRTSPVDADSDGDRVPDGREDRDRDGARDPDETDPLAPDSDGDGILDGEEDVDADGTKAATETDPRERDTDGDSIGDRVERKSTFTDPLVADTDGDGCGDGREDIDQDGTLDPGESDPRKAGDCKVMKPAPGADGDADGIPDAIEDEDGNGKLDPGETDPASADTDGDGLADGAEDRDADGIVDDGETNPRRPDSDCDGLLDGPDKAPRLGEDQDGDGKVDPGETDPLEPDGDHDGLLDGIERGATVNPDPIRCPEFAADADPAVNTDPRRADGDGDGILDGSEDLDGNGRVDPGETDPAKADALAGPLAKVCPMMALRPVTFRAEGMADVQLALPTSFGEIAPLGGGARGLMAWDGTHRVAVVAWRATAPKGVFAVDAVEAALRPAIAGVGALANPTTRAFTSWDGYPAIAAQFDQAGGGDVKARANALADALAGNGAAALQGQGGAVGPFRVHVEYALRAGGAVVGVLAVAAGADFAEPGSFVLGDAAGGSALGQALDGASVRCQRFKPRGGAVDFVFVVDDSGSMAAYQKALGDSATAMAASLAGAALDWRAALVTTSYAQGGPNGGKVRGFTRDIAELKRWLTQGEPDWVGIMGSGTEKCLEAAAKAVSDLTPGVLPEEVGKARAGAAVVVVILGDADDQSPPSAADYLNFFGAAGGQVGGYTNQSGGPVVVHGIVCPMGMLCGETQRNPQSHGQVIAGTGGVRGDITSAPSIAAAAAKIIDGVIGANGYLLDRPPIGATVKVAMDAVEDPMTCAADDLPRSRVDGFDFDGITRTVAFFGACRPSMATKEVAVSYRFWVDADPTPIRVTPPCFGDPSFDAGEADWCKGLLACDKERDLCRCPPDCGGGPPPDGTICNRNPKECGWMCLPDCGGRCVGHRSCDAMSCGCRCSQRTDCPRGWRFLDDGKSCGCVCNEGSLSCEGGRVVDQQACACVCKPDCGGCPADKPCNLATCECTPRIL